jgi:hypothetical protein
VLNKPAPSLSCAALQCCAEGVMPAASFSGRCREAGGEKGEALLEDVVSRGRLAPTPGPNAVSAVLWRSRSSVS